MIKQRILILAAAAALAMLGTDAAFARKPAPAAAKKAAAAEAPPQPTGQLIDYAELEHRIGSEIIVETTFHTVRRGTLIKYTNPGLTIQLGPENGSVEMSIPRETVRNISIVLPAAEPPADAEPAQAAGAGSAEKN